MVDGPPVDLGIPGLGPAVRIGSGGFADVYRCRQTPLNRDVAVKVQRATAADAQARMRFERECHALGAVSGHPNIVGVHGGGFTASGRAYLIMELCPGGSLSDRLARSGPLPPAEVTGIGHKIAQALTVAHHAGIVHRDVKPGNILITAYGEPALADFGIARVAGGQQTATGLITASLAHAAPEVLEGGVLTAASDQYSLGSTLFELLTGQAPHHRPGDQSVWALVHRVLHDSVPDLAPFGMPEPLAGVVRRATARQAADRFESAAELAAELARPAPDRPLPVVAPGQATGRAGTAVLADGSAGPGPSPAETGPVGGRRRRAGPLAAIGMVALVALAAGTWWFGFRRADAATELTVRLPAAQTGPLERDQSYPLAISGAPAGAAYRLLLDGAPAAPGAPDPVAFTPGTPGRHSLVVEAATAQRTVRSEPIPLYVLGDIPSGWRANLASVSEDPGAWPGTLSQFDALVAAGHQNLVLVRSDKGKWNLLVPGFGDDAQAVKAYCDRFGLAIPAQCFGSRVDRGA